MLQIGNVRAELSRQLPHTFISDLLTAIINRMIKDAQISSVCAVIVLHLLGHSHSLPLSLLLHFHPPSSSTKNLTHL